MTLGELLEKISAARDASIAWLLDIKVWPPLGINVEIPFMLIIVLLGMAAIGISVMYGISKFVDWISPLPAKHRAKDVYNFDHISGMESTDSVPVEPEPVPPIHQVP